MLGTHSAFTKVPAYKITVKCTLRRYKLRLQGIGTNLTLTDVLPQEPGLVNASRTFVCLFLFHQCILPIHAQHRQNLANQTNSTRNMKNARELLHKGIAQAAQQQQCSMCKSIQKSECTVPVQVPTPATKLCIASMEWVGWMKE